MEKIKRFNYNVSLKPYKNIFNALYILDKCENFEYSRAINAELLKKYNEETVKNVSKNEVMMILNKYYEDVVEVER